MFGGRATRHGKHLDFRRGCLDDRRFLQKQSSYQLILKKCALVKQKKLINILKTYRTIAQNFNLLFNHSIAVFVQETSALVLDIVGKVVDDVGVRSEARLGEMLALLAPLIQLFGPGTV
jgi:hypothetical protein